MILILILKCRAQDEFSLEIDFGAMELSTPHLTISSAIGNGLNYISKFTSTRLSGSSDKAKPLLDYLLALKHREEVHELSRKMNNLIIFKK